MKTSSRKYIYSQQRLWDFAVYAIFLGLYGMKETRGLSVKKLGRSFASLGQSEVLGLPLGFYYY